MICFLHYHGIKCTNACRKSIFLGIVWLGIGTNDFRIQHLKDSILALKAPFWNNCNRYSDFMLLLCQRHWVMLAKNHVVWNLLSLECHFSHSASKALTIAGIHATWNFWAWEHHFSGSAQHFKNSIFLQNAAFLK